MHLGFHACLNLDFGGNSIQAIGVVCNKLILKCKACNVVFLFCFMTNHVFEAPLFYIANLVGWLTYTLKRFSTFHHSCFSVIDAIVLQEIEVETCLVCIEWLFHVVKDD